MKMMVFVFGFVLFCFENGFETRYKELRVFGVGLERSPTE